MSRYKYWTIEWRRNGMVGVSDGTNHVIFTDREWLDLLLQEEFEIEANGGYPDE